MIFQTTSNQHFSILLILHNQSSNKNKPFGYTCLLECGNKGIKNVGKIQKE